MATRTIKETKGKIQLYGEFCESASTHAETDKEANLYAIGENTLMLELYDSSFDVYRDAKPRTQHAYYEIEVQKLISLIKTHGIVTDKKNPIT